MSPDNWGLIYHQPLPPGYNMAVDWWLTRRAELPILRFYDWNRPVLSLGYRQQFRPPGRLNKFLNRYRLIVRPSGGGYLLHAGAITYSLILPPGNRMSEEGVETVYRLVRDAFAASAQRLGCLGSIRLGNSSGSLAPDCLAEPATHEPTKQGRKWLAAAQLRHRGAVLQHGSVYWNSEKWPAQSPLSRPGFLASGDTGVTKRRELIRAVVRKFDKQIFSERQCRLVHLSPSDWSGVKSQATNFVLEDPDSLPVFER